MSLLQFLFHLLIGYGYWWVLFVIIAIFLAWLANVRFVAVLFVVIPCIVVWLDINWVKLAMADPSWDGAPDLDAIFMIGLLLRLFLIITVLLVVYSLSRTLFKKAKES